jgi:AcrR family transcriptional regulator
MPNTMMSVADIVKRNLVPDLTRVLPMPTATRLERCALELCAKHGYDDVTTEQIASAAEVTQRTFFRHYPTKLDAIYGSTERRTRAFVEDLYRQPQDDSILDALMASIVASSPTDEEAELDLLRAAVLRGTPSLSAELRRYEEELEGHFGAWLASRTRRRADDVSVRVVAAALVAVRRVVLEDWARDGGEYLPAVAAAEVLPLLEGMVAEL